MNAVMFCISQAESLLLGSQASEMMMLSNGAEVQERSVVYPRQKGSAKAWK